MLEDGRKKGCIRASLPGCPDLDASEHEWEDYFITRGALRLAEAGQ